MARPKARYYIYDRAKDQALDLAKANQPFFERYAIVDRMTNKILDDASTQYEARQALAAIKLENS